VTEELRRAAAKTTHRHTAALLTLMADQGWTRVEGARGLTFQHPRSGERYPKPAYVTERMYPGPEAWRLRQIVLFDGGGRISKIWAREGVPWTSSRERALTFKAAMAYVAQEWTPEKGAVDE
jgi:hypothetical protein